MSANRHSFKSTDAARLIRVAEAAGKTVKAMSLEGKRLRLQFDDGTKAKAEPNDWADLKDATDEKRAS